MKRFIQTLFLFGVFYSAEAQAPHKFSYQAVVRNTNGILVANSTIGLKISILKCSVNGKLTFSESHTPTTNANGLLTVEIGSGNPMTSIIDSVNWSSGTFFIKTEIDPLGGNNYNIVSTTQLLTVPFAEYSNVAGSLSDLAMYEEQFSNSSSIPKLNAGISSNNYVSNLHKFNTVTYQKGTNISLNTFSGSITLQPGLYKIQIESPLRGTGLNSTTMSYLSFTGSLSNNMNSYNASLYSSDNCVQEINGFINVSSTETFNLYQYINNNNGYSNLISTDPIPGTSKTTVAKIVIQKM